MTEVQAIDRVDGMTFQLSHLLLHCSDALCMKLSNYKGNMISIYFFYPFFNNCIVCTVFIM